MLKDWVYISGNSGYAMRVESIDEGSCLLDFEGNEGDPFDGVYGEGGIAPIPLTKEMLELNGWNFIEGRWCNANIGINRGYKAFRWVAYERDEHSGESRHINVMDVGYVHELQHFLRICGYDDLANEFRIK